MRCISCCKEFEGFVCKCGFRRLLCNFIPSNFAPKSFAGSWDLLYEGISGLRWVKVPENCLIVLDDEEIC